MPFPHFNWNLLVLIVAFKTPSIICKLILNGEVYSSNFSPLSKEGTGIFPVFFVIEINLQEFKMKSRLQVF